MKQKTMAMMALATSMILGSAAYAQDAHNHGSPKSAVGASQSHDTHCCKPDPSDMKGMQGVMGNQQHDHTQALKKAPTKKPARKPAGEASQTAK